ncbi:ecotropic virus integration site 1 protein [Clonorchis sinensis]|uniref:Ecotropic virus integration site 1 protein n=1 Tax=Clonorchis sinensis TaxID=79923 RepID=G7YMB1_CLOSI|nr:ecotropic virus integration site 1 protein [Clonorchis sinensis]
MIPLVMLLITVHLGSGKKLSALNNLIDSYAPIDVNEYDPFRSADVGFTSKTSKYKLDTKKDIQMRSIKNSKVTKIYRCQECFRTFHYPSWFSQHIETHLRLRLHKCDFCPTLFKSNRGQKSHMIEQHWEHLVSSERKGTTGYSSLLKRRSHLCPRCGKRFCSRTAFDIHKGLHTGGRPYACGVCEYQFTTLSSLRRHKKQCH